MNPAERLLVKVRRACFRLSDELTVASWADRYRYLSSESAAEHGKWTTLPFQAGAFDAVSDPRVSRVVVKSATQMLKTELICNSIGYFAHQDPGPMLVIQPRDADAKAFSKERIAPMVRDTPVLAAIFASSKGRVADNTIEEKLFTGGMLAITSAGSPGNLARRAIRFLFCDEIDKYPQASGSEGNPISLARKRTATFRHRRKEILTCSPTLPGSEIDRAYEASDRREYYVPCPCCGEPQSMMLKFRTQVRWDSSLPTREEQARSARYHCEACDCFLQYRRTMVRSRQTSTGGALREPWSLLGNASEASGIPGISKGLLPAGFEPGAHRNANDTNDAPFMDQEQHSVCRCGRRRFITGAGCAPDAAGQNHPVARPQPESTRTPETLPPDGCPACSLDSFADRYRPRSI